MCIGTSRGNFLFLARLIMLDSRPVDSIDRPINEPGVASISMVGRMRGDDRQVVKGCCATWGSTVLEKTQQLFQFVVGPFSIMKN